MEIDLERGFAPCKEMLIDNEYKLNKHGEKLVFAEDRNTCTLDRTVPHYVFPTRH